MDQDKMSNLYKGPTIDASYQVSVHFGQVVSEETNLFKSTNEKQELPVVAMFVNGSGRYEHFNRGPSIDASYQVLVHLVKRFQRRRFILEIDQSETRIACGGHVC
jgi:hypothetical protein